MNESPQRQNVFFAFFLALGPAVIVASVVLGPGSILSNSKVGAAYGFSMVWVLLLAAGLMTCMVALGARLGVVLKGTMCEELAARTGRWSAVLVGLTIFFICAGFQFGNNLGVLASIDLLLSSLPPGRLLIAVKLILFVLSAGGFFTPSTTILFWLNATIIVFLFGFKKLYKPIECLMMVLVGMMILAFFGNFIYLLVMGGGGQPPADAAAVAPDPAARTGDALIAVVGLIGTTFSIAGAFYQSYLVREKGWGLRDLRQGMIDSVAGISMLGAISLVIMLTAAISFYGRDVRLTTVADVAWQLAPLFGPAAVVLFSLGLFAGAFSSFMVNAMIGGAMLSDGLGLGGKMDSWSTKAFTTVALISGMLVAIFVPADNRVGLLIFAQAATVIGLPLLAIAMLYLATRPELVGERAVPLWMKLAAVIGLVVVLISAFQLARKVIQNPLVSETLGNWLR